MHDMVNIYELLNRIIVNKRYSLSPNLFIEADRTELSEEERSIFDLLKNIVSLGTKIHNDGIEFHPMFVMADDSRTFSIEDISEDDYLILPELLDCYDNDILFTFRGLLNEQAGANIRNEIAHGIISEYACSTGVCLYFGVAVIKLLSLTSVSCYQILKNSKKLKHFEVPKKDALKVIH